MGTCELVWWAIVGIWGDRHLFFVWFYRLNVGKFVGTLPTQLTHPFSNLYVPLARFYAPNGPFTQHTQPLRNLRALFRTKRTLTHPYAPFQQPLSNLCAPFTPPDRPGSVLVYLFTIGLLPIT